MTDNLNMGLSFIGGLVLGVLFFGGLWLTVKKVVTAKRPGLIFMGSFFFRISITLTGFYYISDGNWKKLVICMIGFIATRYVIMQVSMKYKGKQELLNEEAGYETES